MSTEAIVFSGVAVYLVMMLVIGAWASTRTGSTANFIVAGRRMPLWIGSATIIATWFGGSTMMGAAGASYENGLIGVIADPFGGALCLFLVGMFFVRLFRRLRLLTVIDLFENRFGRTASVVAAIGSIISGIGWTAGLLVAFGLIYGGLQLLSLSYSHVLLAGGGLSVLIGVVAWMAYPAFPSKHQQHKQLILRVDGGGLGELCRELPDGGLLFRELRDRGVSVSSGGLPQGVKKTVGLVE